MARSTQFRKFYARYYVGEEGGQRDPAQGRRVNLTRRTAMIAGAASMAAPALQGQAHGRRDRQPRCHGTGLLVKARQCRPATIARGEHCARAEALNPRFNFIAQRHYDYARKAIAAGLPRARSPGCPGCSRI